VPLDDYAELDAALENLRQYDWVIFTSINGVKNVLARMQILGLPATALNRCHVCGGRTSN
jgi:uroporphyrinogen-III synthase